MPHSKGVVLGIDPGLARLGFAVVSSSGSNLSLLTYGIAETDRRHAVSDRLLTIYRKINEIIVKYRPSTMAVETLFFSKNISSAIVVGQARGVALLAAAESKLRVTEVNPNVVKQSLTGNGRAEKRQVQRMIQVLFRLKSLPRPDDAADAIALAVVGCEPPIL